MVTVKAKTLVVDWDTHFWQPLEIWERFIEPRYRDAVVRALAPPDNAADAKIRAQVAPFMAIKGGDDPTERLKWMDEEGIYANIIFPGVAGIGNIEDADVQTAACRAANRWAADFASADPKRLKPCMMLPFRYPEKVLEEFHFAVGSLGLEVAFAAPTPAPERRWSDAALDPIWREMEAAGVVMAFHEFTRGVQGSVGRPVYRDAYPMMYLCGHSVEAQLTLMDLLLGGVYERFPRLPIGFVEAHIAWLPGWLALMDDSFPRTSTFFKERTGTGTLSMLPSDFFRRQGFIAAFPDDTWLEETIRHVGAETVVICSDYPHPQTRYGVLDQLRQNHPDLPEDVRRKILGENALRIMPSLASWQGS
jgi:predicted TIM-barrel fold metal-dependent hydrolase